MFASDPQTVLNVARELAQQGRFEEALEKHLWFHEYAIEFDPGLAGVRLSFALSDWIRLGEQYPPARTALVATRDHTASALRNGNTAPEKFLDVAAINRELNEKAETGKLFLILRSTHPEAARQYYPAAEEGLLACGEYEVCSSFIPDAVVRFESHSDLRRHILTSGGGPMNGTPADVARFVEHMDRHFAEQVVRLIEILVRAGRTAEASQVRELALAETENASARSAILDGCNRFFDGNE